MSVGTQCDPVAGRKRPARILVVDDDAQQARLFGTVLKAAGYDVVIATSGQAAIEEYRRQPADLVVTDVVIPDMSGLDILTDLRENCPSIPVILITAGGLKTDANQLDLMLELGATRALMKPFSSAELLRIVQEVIAHQSGGR